MSFGHNHMPLRLTLNYESSERALDFPTDRVTIGRVDETGGRMWTFRRTRSYRGNTPCSSAKTAYAF